MRKRSNIQPLDFFCARIFYGMHLIDTNEINVTFFNLMTLDVCQIQ